MKSTVKIQQAILDQYTCPITRKIMKEPVIIANGSIYEREAIETYLQNHDTDPINDIKLEHKNLTPANAIRVNIINFLEEYPQYMKCTYLPKTWIEKLVLAIKDQDIPKVEKYLNRDPRLLTSSLENDSTAWHLVCQYGPVELVEILLNTLSNLDMVDKLYHIMKKIRMTLHPHMPIYCLSKLYKDKIKCKLHYY